MNITLPEDRLSRAARVITSLLFLAALWIASHKEAIADVVLTPFTAVLSDYGPDALQWVGLGLVAACTVLAQWLVDLVLVRSFVFRMMVLKGRNIEGKYVAWADSDHGLVAVFSTIRHDGGGYREQGRVFQEDGSLYATFIIRMTNFDEELKTLDFTYVERRPGRLDTTGHGRYEFHYKPGVIAGLRISFLKVLSYFECYYTDDKAKSLNHQGWGHRLSSIAVDPDFRDIPFSKFDIPDKQGELAKALLSSPPVEARKAQLKSQGHIDRGQDDRFACRELLNFDGIQVGVWIGHESEYR